MQLLPVMFAEARKVVECKAAALAIVKATTPKAGTDRCHYDAPSLLTPFDVVDGLGFNPSLWGTAEQGNKKG